MKKQSPAKIKKNKNSTEESGSFKLIKFLLYSIAIFIFIAITIFMINIDKILKDDTIPENVSFLGENLGSMKSDIAVQRVRNIMKAIENRSLTICFKDKVWMVNPKKVFDFTIEKDGLIERLLSIGNIGTLLSRIRVKLRLYTGRDKINLNLKYFYNKEKLRLFSELITLSINREAEPAKVVEASPYKRLIREIPGYNISALELSNQIIKSLENIQSYRTSTLFIRVHKILPSMDYKSKIKQLNCKLISKFSIKLPKNEIVRKRNIEASKIIDGLILTGNKKLSLNALFSKLNDFKSNFYEKNPELSGYFPERSGIDIMATSIYNISLLSGFDILKRFHHLHVDIEHSYIKPGRDAYIDLKILGKNNKDLIIKNRKNVNSLFLSEVKDNFINMRVYSSKILPAKIELISKDLSFIEPEEIKYIDRSMANGKIEVIKEGLPGVRVTTQKKIIRNDNKVDILPVSEDIYQPISRKVKIGKKSN